MDASSVLTVLKFGGILVSGAMGILGTVTETREQVPGKPRGTKRLTLWGRWALVLAIMGFLCAGGAQVAEEIKAHHEESLIHSVRTSFSKVSISPTFELAVSNPEVAKLLPELEKVARDGSTNSEIRVNIRNKDCVILDIKFGTIDHYTFNGRVYGLLNQLKNSTPFVAINRIPRTPFVSEFSASDLYTEFRDPWPLREVWLIYSTKSRRLFVTVPIMLSREDDWTLHRERPGIKEIAGGQLGIGFRTAKSYFSNTNLASCIKLEWVETWFGPYAYTFDKLTVIRCNETNLIYQASIPSFETILADKVSPWKEAGILFERPENQ